MFLTQKNSDKIVTFFYCYGKWLICSMFFCCRACNARKRRRACMLEVLTLDTYKSNIIEREKVSSTLSLPYNITSWNQ